MQRLPVTSSVSEQRTTGEERPWEMTSPTTLWGWLPIGKNTIMLDADRVSVSSVCCCCCCGDRTFQLDDIETVQARRSCVNPLEFLFLMPISMISGFFLHCIPSAFIGVADSLGSSGTHQLLGGVWGAFALITLVLLAFVLRPAQVVVSLGTDTCCSCATVVYEAFSMRHAQEVAQLCRLCLSPPAEVPANQPTLREYSNARRYIEVTTGLGVLLLLVINAVLLFAVFVSKCSDCGGCGDDGPPRDGCYYSAVGGEPEALVCGILLGGMILLFVRRFYVVHNDHGSTVELEGTIEVYPSQQANKSNSQIPEL